MDLIGVHLNECPHCRGEYQSLLDTKRLLASLAHRTSRAEIESLLQAEEVNTFPESGANGFFRGVLRPKPLTATALLSLAGLWIASASLDGPTDGTAPGAGGISAQLSVATMPGVGMGLRSLRYLTDRAHGGTATIVMGPAHMDGLILSPESPFPIAVSGDGLRQRRSSSLNNVLFTAEASYNPSSLGSSVSGYAGSNSNAFMNRGTDGNSAAYSMSAQRVGYAGSDRSR
jgi:hypothetical protein